MNFAAKQEKKRLWVQLLTLRSFSVARLFAGATGCTQRKPARQLQHFTNGMVINKYENDEPQHGWFRVTTERFSMPQFLHLLLWNFSHKTLIVILLQFFFSEKSWKSKKFTNYEIMTRSSDNAIAIINWIWTWSDLHSAWLIFCFMLRSSLSRRFPDRAGLPGRLHFQIAQVLVSRTWTELWFLSACFGLWYL